MEMITRDAVYHLGQKAAPDYSL